MNFPNVKWERRTGAIDQTHIQGIPSVENETTISAQLHNGTPWVQAITNTQLRLCVCASLGRRSKPWAPAAFLSEIFPTEISVIL